MSLRAPLVNEFNQQHLDYYINFRRPCFFPETRIDNEGKQRMIYRHDNMMTPYENLKSLPSGQDHLKAGVSFEILEKLAHQISDNQEADQLLFMDGL